MQYLKITNAGELDPRAMTLMGASDKRDDGEAIGFFGSGNKYALACLLRNNLDIRLFSGEREIKIEAKDTQFRDKTFKVIWVDSEATSITTDTGPKWRVYDAIREFWSNALDEGEATRELVETVSGASSLWGTAGVTTIYIQRNQEVNFMLQDWGKYFVPKDAPVLFSNQHGSIIDPEYTEGTPNYFRRGVWCCQDMINKPLFSYSFVQVNLPESRLVSSHIGMRSIASVLAECSNKHVISAMLDNVEGDVCAEWESMEYVYQSSGQKFYKALEAVVRSKGFEYVGELPEKHRVSEEDQKKTLWASTIQLRILTRTGLIDVLTKREYQKGYKIIPWPIGVKEIVDEHVAVLLKAGIDVQWPVVFGEMVNKDHLALADTTEKCVVLSPKVMQIDERELRICLIEEYVHLKYGSMDYTHAMQTAYLDVIFNLVEKMEKL